MKGRKIVFRAKRAVSGSKQTRSSDEPTPNSDRSAAQVSQSLKTTAAGKRHRSDQPNVASKPRVVFRLTQRDTAPSVPTVSEISVLNDEELHEVGELRAKAIPEPFQPCSSLEGVSGEVYGCTSEPRSAPSTPLPKTKSLDKKHEHEDKPKHDAFDEALDALLIYALELKTLTKDFLPERDSAKLEQKLHEYVAHLGKLERMTTHPASPGSDREKRESQEVPYRMWEAIKNGIHPDTYLLEQSEALLKQSKLNIEKAKVIEKFLEVGKKLPKTDRAPNAEKDAAVTSQP